jgi:flagellar assembly factor FliW
MLTLQSKLFGPLQYDASQVIRLAAPLPGLPQLRFLLPVSQPMLEPFVFFQSVDFPDLCLLASPARIIKQDFEMVISNEERGLLRLPSNVTPGVGSTTGIFAFVSAADDRAASANLLAPLVVHFRENLALQSIQPSPEDYLRYPVPISVGGLDAC